MDSRTARQVVVRHVQQAVHREHRVEGARREVKVQEVHHVGLDAGGATGSRGSAPSVMASRWVYQLDSVATARAAPATVLDRGRR
jgi:hypothetical protein